MQNRTDKSLFGIDINEYTQGVDFSVLASTVDFLYLRSSGSASGRFRTVKKVFKIVPAATKLTKAVDTYSGVKLVWSRSSSASGYLIYRSTDGGSYKRIKGITSWRTGVYIDRSATSSWTAYSYKVYVYKKVQNRYIKRMRNRLSLQAVFY